MIKFYFKIVFLLIFIVITKKIIAYIKCNDFILIY